MIYIVIIFFLLYCAIVHDVRGLVRRKKEHYYVLFWIFFLLAGLRHGIGGDTYQFRIFWDTLPTFDNFSWDKLTVYRYEFGWVFLSFVMKSIFGSFVSLQLLLAWIFNIGLFKIIYKYSNYPFMVLLLFFIAGDQYFHIELTFMRQAYAVAIFLLWGVKFLNSRKYLKYFITITICGLMHFSSVALFVLPLFWNMNLENRKTRKHFLITVVSFAVLVYIALNFTPLAELKGLIRLLEALNNVGEKVEDNELVRFFNTSYAYVAYYLVILCGAKHFHLYIPFKGALFFGMFVIIISPYVGDFQRLMFFIIIFIDISLANIIARFSRHKMPLFLVSIISFFIGSNILFYQRYTDKEQTLFLYPYYSWFEEEPSSHHKYFRERLMDGWTVSHQIYDYNKIKKE